MPKPGYKAITISEETYEKIQKIIINENYRHGYMKYKSVKEFIEKLVDEMYEKIVEGKKK